ncbi:MAG: PIN domain-containing protein [Symploca sp. SIO2E6]|nr:PIN domain-containing protein [Symploca sp. SIO2E6]
MRVLIDTNIILDFLLQREPFFQDAELLFQAIDSGKIVGYATASTLTDIFYIARRHTQSIEQARQAVSLTLTAMEICSVNRAVLESAFGSGLADFEDAIQIACAVSQRVDAIVTRDMQGFISSSVPVLSIQEIIIGINGQNG